MIDFSRVGFEPAPPTAPPKGQAPSPPPTTRNVRLEFEAEGIDPGSVVDLDLSAARRAFADFEPRVKEVRALAESMIVKDEQSARDATELAARVLSLHDEIEDLRKKKIAEPDKYVRGLNATCKPIKDDCQAIAGKGGILKRKLGDYQTRERLRLQEIEKRQQEDRARLQAELNKEAEQKGLAPVTLAPVTVPQKTGPIRSDSGTASTKTITVAVIKDLSAVPRNYIEGVFRRNFHTGDDPPLDNLSESAWSRLKTLLMEAHTAGLRCIPGVEFAEKDDVSIRR